jgi:hypothetical protein
MNDCKTKVLGTGAHADSYECKTPTLYLDSTTRITGSVYDVMLGHLSMVSPSSRNASYLNLGLCLLGAS